MDYYRTCPEFGGCPSNDEIQKVHDPKKFFIINMTDRDQGGSHWVLLFQNLYFDSFGCPPKLNVKPYATVWNDEQYQDFHSSACGFYCIYVADNLLAGRAPTQGLIADIDETTQNNSELVLKKYFDGQIGEGFFDRFRPNRTRESARLRKFLDTVGDQPVVKVEIARKSVGSQSIVKRIMDVLSAGRFSKKQKELGYDDLKHNYTLITLSDGSVWNVEKNARVEATKALAQDFVTDRSNVPVTGKLTLKEMLANASKDDPKFWEYDARSSNCQDFTKSLLEKNGLTPEHPPEKQDAVALLDTLGKNAAVPKMLTDAAAYADQVIHGGSLSSLNLNRWY